MITIKHNAFVKYSVVVIDDRFVFKYKCWLRYNILTVTIIDDTIDLNQSIDFKSAKMMMMATVESLNKILN